MSIQDHVIFSLRIHGRYQRRIREKFLQVFVILSNSKIGRTPCKRKIKYWFNNISRVDPILGRFNPNLHILFQVTIASCHILSIRLLSSVMWNRVIWNKDTIFSEEHTSSFFRVIMSGMRKLVIEIHGRKIRDLHSVYVTSHLHVTSVLKIEAAYNSETFISAVRNTTGSCTLGYRKLLWWQYKHQIIL